MTFRSPYFDSAARHLGKLGQQRALMKKGYEAAKAYDAPAAPAFLQAMLDVEAQLDRVKGEIALREHAEASRAPELRQSTVARLSAVLNSAGNAVYGDAQGYASSNWVQNDGVPNENWFARPPLVDAGQVAVGKALLETPLFAATRLTSNGKSNVSLNLGEIEFRGTTGLLRYEGPQLTTSHGDVFLACLFFSGHDHFGRSVHVSFRQLLAKLARNASSGKNHMALRAELKALHLGSFFVDIRAGEGRSVEVALGWRLIGRYELKHQKLGSAVARQSG